MVPDTGNVVEQERTEKCGYDGHGGDLSMSRVRGFDGEILDGEEGARTDEHSKNQAEFLHGVSLCRKGTVVYSATIIPP